MKSIVTKTIQFARSLYGYWRFPGECYGCNRGVFETLEQAMAAAPKTKKIGYDEPNLAKEYKEKFFKGVASYDYPMLFWLKGLLQEGSTVFDFGGNVGTHFYGYEKYLNYPHNFKWIVCDVPAIAEAGQELAKQENRTELAFTQKLEDADGADIFMASGSIQYVESLAERLSKFASCPKHILINRLPLYDGEQFVSLQNGGQVFYPHYVFNQKEFIDSICTIGYELVDIWVDAEDFTKIPFHPEKSLRTFRGLYFRLEAGLKVESRE